MMTARGTGKQGETVVCFGLTEENVTRLKDDCPIVFHSKDIDLASPTRMILTLVHDQEDMRYRLPEGVIGDPQAIVIGLLESMLDQFRGTIVERKVDPNLTLLITIEKDLEALQTMFAPRRGPRTQVRYQGFPLSDIPPSEN